MLIQIPIIVEMCRNNINGILVATTCWEHLIIFRLCLHTRRELGVNILQFYSSLYDEGKEKFLPQSNFQNVVK